MAAENLKLAKQKVEQRNRARADKLYLATEILGYDFQPDVHQELFDQFIPFDSKKPWSEQSPISKRIVLWPRGHYKTTAIIVDIIQAIINFPDIRVLIMQGGLRTTRNLLREIASHFVGQAQNSKLTEVFPEFCGTKVALKLTADGFVTTARIRKQLQQGTVSVASARAIKTGQHFDIAYFDDLVNDQNYRSKNLLTRIEQDYKMCQPLLDPPFYAYITGTRYAHGDLYENIIRADAEENKWVVSVKTCWTDDGKEVRFPQRQTKGGRFIGFTRQMLTDLQNSDAGMFASQYLNRPASTANEAFSRATLEAALVDPNSIKYLSNALLFCDLATGSEGDRDDCVILAAKTDHLGKIYVVDGRGGRWDTATTAMHVIEMSLRHRPLMVFFERSAAGITFVDYLRLLGSTKGILLPVDFLGNDNRADAKFIRISSLAGYFRNDRLHFFRGISCWERMVEQFTRWTGVKHAHDDYPDTVALLTAYFAKNVPVITPLSQDKHAWIKMLEREGTDVTHQLLETKLLPDSTMGDDFSC